MTVTYNPKELQDALDALIAAQCDDNMLTFKHMVEDPRLSGLKPYLLKEKWESWPTTGDKLLDGYFGTPDETVVTINSSYDTKAGRIKDTHYRIIGALGGHRDNKWSFNELAEHLTQLINKELVKMANTALATQSKEE